MSLGVQWSAPCCTPRMADALACTDRPRRDKSEGHGKAQNHVRRKLPWNCVGQLNPRLSPYLFSRCCKSMGRRGAALGRSPAPGPQTSVRHRAKRNSEATDKLARAGSLHSFLRFSRPTTSSCKSSQRWRTLQSRHQNPGPQTGTNATADKDAVNRRLRPRPRF